jgi:putative ABC transport system permease protein
MTHILLTVRLALKGLTRSRSTSLLAVSILALGLAAPAVFFSILVGSIRPLPVPDGGRIVRIDVTRPARGGQPLAVRANEVGSLRDLAALDGVGAFRTSSPTMVDVSVAASRVQLGELTPEALPLLRVVPVIGRWATLEEADEAVLIREDVWVAMYDRDPEVLGRAVTLGGEPRTIVGVMPEGFGFPFNQNAWVVFDPDRLDEAVGGSVEMFGRLAEGGSVDAATAEAASRWRAGDEARTAERVGGVVEVRGYTGGRGERDEAVAFLSLVLVALSLTLIACANVANLLLVRASERVRSLGIQSALGASRWQVGGQLFAESLILSVVGGAIGLLLAGLTVAALQKGLAAAHFGYFWMRLAVDGPVVVFTSALVVGTALVAGSLPALRVMSVDVREVLRGEGSSVAGSGLAWGRLFVTTQLALSCAALVAAGLTARSMVGSRDFSGDIPAQEILLANLSLSAASGVSVADLVLEARRLPGARAAAVALGAPGFFEPRGRLEVEGVEYDRPEDRDRIQWNAVTADYFTVADLDIRSGRLFTARDGAGGAPVAVVNESFASRFSPDEDVLGRSVRVTVGSDAGDSEWRTVVGVVSDAGVGEGEWVRHDRVYVPFDQAMDGPAMDGPAMDGLARDGSAMILIRGDTDAGDLAAGLRGAVAAVDRGIAVSAVRTLADGYAYLTRVPRAMGALAFGGGVAGLLVAAVGLYGLVAFRVRQRRRELGVRLALGADGGRLAYETMSFALKQLVPAIVIGLSLAWLVGPILAIFALGVDPRSPSTLAGVGIVFLSVGMVAAAIPTARAAATDPSDALRAD